jgi:hypothetical protein
MVIITVLRITDNIISKSAVSEFSIKLKGKDDEGGDDSVVIFIIPEPFVINFILQLLSYCTLLSSLQKFISSDTAATDDFFK